MSLILSDHDAALLEAGRRSQNLEQRYRHAVENMVAAGPPRQLMEDLAGKHLELTRLIHRLLKERDLLPRQPDGEVEDLQRLMDQVLSWLDNAGIQTLTQVFAEEEGELLTELENAAQDPATGKALTPWINTIRDNMEQLEEWAA